MIEEYPEPATPNKHWWQKQINLTPQWFWHYKMNLPQRVQLVLCILVIALICLLLSQMDYPLFIKYSLFLYLAFWTSIGSLVGLVVSKNSIHGPFLGAIIGAVLAAVLMC
jgi:hypothetical protein